ncbi:hypothetical protein [Ornithinimicrobium sp. Y1694]|uniref:hypothetical protein n=1 Tax=Ornithinimicrobium sp. Y1694 TaxID=3418590 RepID=UPI003CF18E48
MQRTLDANPGSFYIRTDLSCDNFNRPGPNTGGNYIYAVLAYAAGDTVNDVCTAVDEMGGAYGYFLSENVDPGQPVSCG